MGTHRRVSLPFRSWSWSVRHLPTLSRTKGVRTYPPPTHPRRTTGYPSVSGTGVPLVGRRYKRNNTTLNKSCSDPSGPWVSSPFSLRTKDGVLRTGPLTRRSGVFDPDTSRSEEKGGPVVRVCTTTRRTADDPEKPVNQPTGVGLARGEVKHVRQGQWCPPRG